MLYVIHILLNMAALLVGARLFMTYLTKVQDEESELSKQLIKHREQLSTIKHQNEDVLAENHRLEQLSQSTASLYEISKDLSTSLKFRDKAPLLKNKIWNLLLCRRIKLIILKQPVTEEAAHINKIIELSNETVYDEHADFFLQPQSQDHNICDYLRNNGMNELLIFDSKTNFVAKNLDLDIQVSSFMALPLNVKEQTIAIMTLENISPQDIEKARIIGSQLALDLYKNQLYEQVEELSIIDSLTEVYLRRHFMNRFQEEMSRSEKLHLPLSCLMIDIDHFKSYNDNFGHLVGDVVLKELAQVIKDNIREMDLVCRYGGEEFCVLLPETPLQAAQIIAERLRSDVEKRTFQAYDKELRVTISLGLGSYPDQAQSVQGLIDHADQCLYQAKNNGRNRVCC